MRVKVQIKAAGAAPAPKWRAVRERARKGINEDVGGRPMKSGMGEIGDVALADLPSLPNH